ncbi:glycosyltransferase family 4 protein [bacterium]|nr:glycosyltransferase family 4 protein [bacterium]
MPGSPPPSRPAPTRPDRVLLVHNHYLEPGGEDTVVEAECQLLQSHGHEVELLHTANEDLAGRGVWTRAGAALNAIYSAPSRRLVARAIQRFQPDLVHVHNFFNRLSPSIYDAAAEHRVPVVQTLHNYRLLCVNGLLYRQGHPCEDCLGRRVLWPGIVHACYRQSRAASAVVAAMLAVHHWKRTWPDRVTRYIALTDFARDKFVQAGLPADRIMVKPNMVYPTPAIGDGRGGFALYVGRLSVEKGIDVLLQAWRQTGSPVPLHIVGHGPLAPAVDEFARTVPGVRWHGRLPRERVLDLMKQAYALVFPSTCYEMFSMTAIEALSVGLPVITTRLGSMATLIQPEQTGLHFPPGDAAALADQIAWAYAHPVQWEQMRRQARAEFERHYTADRNYEILRRIYHDAVAAVRSAP